MVKVKEKVKSQPENIGYFEDWFLTTEAWFETYYYFGMAYSLFYIKIQFLLLFRDCLL